MKRFLQAVCLAVMLSTGIALGQNDLGSFAPVTVMDNVAITTTSATYAMVVVAPNETIHIQAYGTGTGTLAVFGTLDTNAKVVATTATYFQIFSTTTLPNLIYIESPPAFVRVVWTRTAGNLTVLMRSASGSTFRLVQ